VTRWIWPRRRGRSLPLMLLGEDADLGDEVTITIKAKITGLQKNEYEKTFNYEALEAEVV